MQNRTIGLGIAVAFVTCMAATAQSGSLSAADKQFMTVAARENMTEAHLGQMAESQASDASVKAFGQTLDRDHQTAYQQLNDLAKTTGENIPNGIDVGKDSSIQQLTKLKGSTFDRRFVQHEIQDHQKALAEFKREAAHGQNPAVKSYAQQQISTLEQHLHTAEQLAKTERHT